VRSGRDGATDHRDGINRALGAGLEGRSARVSHPFGTWRLYRPAGAGVAEFGGHLEREALRSDEIRPDGVYWPMNRGLAGPFRRGAPNTQPGRRTRDQGAEHATRVYGPPERRSDACVPTLRPRVRPRRPPGGAAPRSAGRDDGRSSRDDLVQRRARSGESSRPADLATRERQGDRSMDGGRRASRGDAASESAETPLTRLIQVERHQLRIGIGQ